MSENDRRVLFDAFDFDEQDKPDSRAFLRRLYHRQIRISETTFLRTQNYVALYGFCRSISLIFLAFLWTFFFLCVDVDVNNFSEMNISFEWGRAIYLGLMSGIISAIFGYGLLKFQRRFAEELIFAALNDLAPVGRKFPI